MGQGPPQTGPGSKDLLLPEGARPAVSTASAPKCGACQGDIQVGEALVQVVVGISPGKLQMTYAHYTCVLAAVTGGSVLQQEEDAGARRGGGRGIQGDPAVESAPPG